MWDKATAVAYLDAHVAAHSLGRCAEYVREAIEAGGVVLIRHTSAKDYGGSLTHVGFLPVAIPGSPPQAGDIVVIQSIKGHPDGHMAMFDGHLWVSDFKQLHGLYPGPSYRVAKPPFTIYRYPG
jgi:hypothetical protein